MTDYREAPAAAEIASKLIEEHHPELGTIRIDYLFRSPPTTRSGRLVLGKARRISGLNAWLANHPGAFFVMELADEPWEQLGERRRAALIDHGLCHMDVDEDGAPVLVSHDVEEFTRVVERHGIWTSDLDTFNLALQLALPFEGADGDIPGGIA